MVDGARLLADAVVDAAGRAGRATRGLGPRRSVGGPCGQAYVDRMYRLDPGAAPGPLTNPLVWLSEHDGYLSLVFPHDQRYFSALIVRPWVEDHIHTDSCHVDRWNGEDVDLDAPLPSDLILAAAEVRPEIMGSAMGFGSMHALPATLRAAEPIARAVFAAGWRPADRAPPPGGTDAWRRSVAPVGSAGR